MVAYAKQAKDNELESWAAEIKLRAERPTGGLLAQRERATGTKGQVSIPRQSRGL